MVRNSQADAFQVIPVAPLLTYPLSWLKPVTRPPVDTAVFMASPSSIGVWGFKFLMITACRGVTGFI